MKISELELLQPVLCKHAGQNVVQSEIFEIMKLAYSLNKKAVYVRITFGMAGQNTSQCHHYWRDINEIDSKFEVFDTLTTMRD